MENDELRAASARIGSSSVWRSSGVDVFSGSSRREEDEQELKWAAIEKLPTYLRMTRGILTEAEGQPPTEIHINKLGPLQRKNLVERLVKIAEQDNEKFLFKLRDRIDRFDRFDSGMENNGCFRPSGFLNSLYLIPSRKKPFTVLDDVSGIIKPKRPSKLWKDHIIVGTGWKTWQRSKIIAQMNKNHLKVYDSFYFIPDELQSSGRVLYNGRGMEEFVPQRTSAYISQTDLHIGEMTVRETLAFSARCQGIGTRYDMLAELSRREKAENIKPDPDLDIYMKVTSRKDQEQYWASKDEPYIFVTVREFAEAFQSFHIGRKLGDELATPFDTSKGHPAVLTKNKYGVSKKELLKACVSREFLLMKRNSFVYIFKMWQLILTGFITMTLFLRTEMHRDTETDGGIFMGALFFVLIVIMFNGYSELSMSIMKLPVFYKQRDLLFFPSWAYSLPTWILKIPITLVEVGIWVVMTYYVIGFDPSIERFIKQYFLLVCINQMASGLFRFMGAVGRNIIVANTVGSFALLAVMVMGGFILSRVDVKRWWLWGYWFSPMMYAQNAIAVNEFLGKSWLHVPPNSTEPLGVKVLKSRGIFPEAYWYWIGVGASIGYMLLFNFLFPLALQYLDPFDKPQALISEEALAERNAGRKEHIIELSSRFKGSSVYNFNADKGNENRKSVCSRTLSARVGSIGASKHNTKRGMVLPFTPLSITFDEIRYAVEMPQEMKNQGILEDRLELLKGVNGAFRPGVLTALMGVSGAGKTTLMDVLSGRKSAGYIQGQITISGYPKKQETFARIAGYCEQTDIHSPHVTVYESLVYSAWLRLPLDVDSATRKMFIEEVMELVELTSLREALVGLPGVNGLSTEQRKRLTIAVELVANPSIIFMDEPTSGLDARAAAIVMRTVRNTVDTGRTVVCTIHQPSIDIFDAFDEGINGVPKIKNGYNPATWMLEVTSEAQEAALEVNFTEIYKNSDLYRQRRQDIFNAMGSMYAAVLFIGIQNSTSVQPVVAIERTVFYRERAAGMYSALPYAFGQVAIEIPYILIQTLVYGVIVYAMIGFDWTLSKFFWYIFFMFFTFLYFTFYGMMAVGLTPDHNVAAIVSFGFYMIWNLFSGFVIPRTRMPVWWRWYFWICPVSWTLYGLVTSQFGDIKERIESGESVEEFVRSYFGYRDDFVGVAAAVLVGFSLLFGFTFAFSIKAFNFQKR
ncbi:Pleiotropic drug resistance protein [Vigna angularis]|uniref:Pleiotropic drug resistance protein n=1 Tax=Phaseolus angularis TaxID=3914 RepID=A0A8T0KJN7_PHAAN|nr:Pleiotropic drug resistance protein [Vigna angularis]